MARRNAIEMHSTHKKGKLAVAERLIRTLENKIYKYLISISKNICLDKLDDIANKYNNTHLSISKMKHVDVKSSIDSGKEINEKNPKFKIGDIVRISKYRNILAKSYTPN